MGDALKKVQRGDDLEVSARAWNTFIDTARQQKVDQSLFRRQSLVLPKPAGIVSIRNDSGADRSRFDVLGIDGPIIEPDDNEAEFCSRVALAGSTPADSDHFGNLAVLQEPLADGKIGRACINGLTIARVNIDDTQMEFVDVADSDATALEAGLVGAGRIIWIEDDAGSNKWAIVDLCGVVPVPYWGKLDDSLSQGSSQTVSVWMGDTLADSGVDVTAYDNLLGAGESLDASAWVKIEFWPFPRPGRWYVTGARC